jgi:UDP-2,3-diacylglucosamine pyrophosphatase LpxH
MKPEKIDALFISDVHLGSKGSNAKDLLHVLKQYEPKHLFIVGDFIDGWLLKRRHYWTQDFTNVIRKILSFSKNDVQIVYITGNHDEFLRQYDTMSFGENIHVTDEYYYDRYWITHGDKYDGIVKLRWLAHFGSFGYELAILIDRTLKRLGYKSSLSKFLKEHVKQAVTFITSFEMQLVYQAKLRNCIGVIAGHIHTPSDKLIDGIHYLNCGDWIENNSYIVYTNKQFSILSYKNIC